MPVCKLCFALAVSLQLHSLGPLSTLARMLTWSNELCNHLFDGTDTSEQAAVVHTFAAALADAWLQFDNVGPLGLRAGGGRGAWEKRLKEVERDRETERQRDRETERDAHTRAHRERSTCMYLLACRLFDCCSFTSQRSSDTLRLEGSQHS